MDLRLNVPSANATAIKTPLPANPSRRILVVEDDVAIRKLNAQVLLVSGFQVDTSEDGVAGWEALHANKFDLLITDHNMPRMSGLELVKKVRSACMTMPVILATGALPKEELERHPWLQLAAILFKPFSAGQLLKTVVEVLHTTACDSGDREIRFPLLTNTFK
jgi:DNA-binding response OmpR family regulator